MIRFDLQRFAIKTVINGEVVEFLPVATTSDRGGVVVGDGVSVDSTGKISIPNATTVKSGLMSSSDKTKLNGIASGAQVNVIETIKVNGAALTPSSKSVNVDISGKVDKVSGKQLSTNDYTTNEKNKLSGIASGAQVNVIESISIDGTNQTISSKKVALNLSDYAKKSDIASGIRIKGSVNSFSDLPTNAVTGDLYNIKTAGGTDGEGIAIRAGDNVVRTEDGKWDVMAGTVDLSNYVQKDGSKVLSTNDYTTTEKNKLAGIASGAQVNVIETVKVNGTALTPSSKAVNIDISGKVDKVSGKQLSTNDYTTNEKNKLSSIASGAQVNVIETVKVDGTALNVSNKSVNIDISGKVDKVSGKGLSTNDYTTTEKNKLAGIDKQANKYVLPAAQSSVIGGVKVDSVANSNIVLSADGSISIPAASTSQAGVVKYGGGTSNYLRADGSWTAPPNTNNAMTQNISTVDSTYPILLTATANATANLGAKTAIFGSGVKVNPKTSVITAVGFNGSLEGNATSATKATKDGSDRVIVDTYETKANAITGVSASGRTITFTKGSGDTVTIQTQDNNTTYKVASSANITINGTLVPSVASGTTNKYLRSDGSWQIPPDNNTTYSAGTGLSLSGTTFGLKNASTAESGGVKLGGGTSNYLRADGNWATPPNTTYSVATSSANGLMSANDKKTLDSVPSVYLTKTNASNTYLTKTDASNTYLGKTAKAASATTADIAYQSKKLENELNGANVQVILYGNPELCLNTFHATDRVPIRVRQVTNENDGIDYVELMDEDGNTRIRNDLYVEGDLQVFQTIHGDLDGNATSATKATKDGSDRVIVDTYETKSNAITGVTVEGKKLTFTKGNGSSVTLNTQDTNTTYKVFSSGNATINGTLIPSVASGTTGKYLQSNGTWAIPYSDATSIASGLMSANDKKTFDSIPNVYLTKTANVSEMGRHIDMHYDNATSAYDYDVRLLVDSQGTVKGSGVLKIVGANVKATKFEGSLTGDVTGNALTASSLQTARALQVSLNKTSSTDFQGNAAVTRGCW